MPHLLHAFEEIGVRQGRSYFFLRRSSTGAFSRLRSSQFW
jgi:hypothetical protein